MAKTYGDRWETVKQIGEGGQGHVFEVRDIQSKSDERFVLKRLKNINRIDRFKKEVQASQLLDSPGICKVIDFSMEDPYPYFVSPLIEGRTLRAVAPINVLNALDIFIDLCDIVGYAHGKGVVHRDLKPDNIMVKSCGQVVILDFGLCYLMDEQGERLTETMEQVGSRFYILKWTPFFGPRGGIA